MVCRVCGSWVKQYNGMALIITRGGWRALSGARSACDALCGFFLRGLWGDRGQRKRVNLILSCFMLVTFISIFLFKE